MKAILLAAGSGTRLTTLTRTIPKALVTVAGQPLVDYVSAFVATGPFEAFVVIGGYQGELLRAHLAGRSGLQFFMNPDYTKGNTLTLAAARTVLDGDLLLLNVDHIFPLRLLRRFLAARLATDAPTAFVDFDRPLFDDDMKVELDQNRRILRISKTLGEYQAGYIGSTFIPAGFVPRYLQALDALVARTAGMANVEAVLQQLADDGCRPHVFDATGIRWLEVDTQADRANAERILAHVPGYLDDQTDARR